MPLPMKLRARDAIIPREKLRDYLLSVAHPDGRGKAEHLGRLGYSQDALSQPNGRTGWVRTIWIILTGETAPRLVTLIPAEKS